MLFIVNRCNLRTVFEMTCCKKGNWKQAALYLRDGQLYSCVKIDPLASCFVAKKMGFPLIGFVALCTLKHYDTKRRSRKVVEAEISSGAWPDDKSNHSTLEHGLGTILG
jgi:hypothetical protein